MLFSHYSLNYYSFAQIIRHLQCHRQGKKNIYTYSLNNNECKKILELAFNKLGFSARAYTKILKVSRTIADLDYKENIEKEHLLEAYMKGFKDASTLAYMKIHKNKPDET